MSRAPTTVLLVGDTSTRSATLWKWLAHRSCDWQFAASFHDASKLLAQREFDLVLCQYQLPDRTALPIVDLLKGSHSTLIFTAKFPRGNRWLPMIERGKRCLDRPLLRTTELPNALREMLAGRSGGSLLANAVSEAQLQEVGSK
jgi:CheY-like chemotaxis protein